MKIKLAILTLTLYSISAFSQTWKNPHSLDNEWYLYGVGDPYLLKYQGKYYLYCSTKDIEDGVKCWSSKDLITWQDEGLCATDEITHGAYAPEVIYWGGKFYMYTSPAGNGHYILKADDPTGPFEVITNNLGHSIDGSVFKEDDGSLYFYHAGTEGIYGHAMSSPTAIGSDVLLNAYMNGWTEGPCVIKRNGIYYMIYTGNHVWSYGYRIDYASSKAGPISGWQPAKMQDPVVLNSMGDFVGLGHGSMFLGPDLDSYFITYHNLAGDYGYGPYRRLNFDRIAWNGEKMEVLGPTNFAQQEPDMPDFYDYFDSSAINPIWSTPNGGSWSLKNDSFLIQTEYTDASETWYKIISTETTSDDYSAEFNAKEIDAYNTSNKFGAVFSYTDESNFGIALFHSSSKQLEINFLINGSWSTAQYYDLTGVDDYSKWHCIRIEKDDTEYSFFVDGMHKATLTSSLPAGKIGYLSSWTYAGFGFIAFSNKINGSGIYNVYKPVPGTIDAIHFNSGGEGISFHKENETTGESEYPRSDEINVVECNRGGYAIESIQINEWLVYNINVEDSTLYNVGITYATDLSTSQVQLFLDNEVLSETVNLPATGGSNKYRTYVINDILLSEGYHTLKISAIDGGFNFYSMQFVYADNGPFEETRDFTFTLGAGWEYSDGTWFRKEDAMYIDGYGKRTFGSSYWRNYTIEADIQLLQNFNAGILLRTNNPALGSDNSDPILGTNFLQGYFVGFTSNKIVLGKQNYNWQELETAEGTYSLNIWYHLRAVINDNNIKVYVDDMETPVINYNDTMAFINGYPGLRSCNTNALFDNFTVSSDTLYTSSLIHTDPVDKIRIYPNPAHNTVSLYLTDTAIRKIDLINTDGLKVYSNTIDSNYLKLNIEGLERGIYLVNMTSGNCIYTKRLVVF